MDIHELETLLTPIIPMKVTSFRESRSKNELKQSLKEQAVKLYEATRKQNSGGRADS